MLQVTMLYLAAISYSVARYVVFAPQNIEHLPVFVMNKGVSMGAAFCFSLAFFTQWRLGRGVVPTTRPQLWFRAGVVGVFLHVPLSLAILRKDYFPEFFLEAGRFTFGGEMVFLFGALTVGGIYLLARQDWSWKQRWLLSVATMLTLFTHTLFMGISRGLNINASHGYLPPMWLLGLIGIALGTIYLLMDRPAGKIDGTEGGQRVSHPDT